MWGVKRLDCSGPSRSGIWEVITLMKREAKDGGKRHEFCGKYRRRESEWKERKSNDEKSGSWEHQGLCKPIVREVGHIKLKQGS